MVHGVRGATQKGLCLSPLRTTKDFLETSSARRSTRMLLLNNLIGNRIKDVLNQKIRLPKISLLGNHIDKSRSVGHNLINSGRCFQIRLGVNREPKLPEQEVMEAWKQRILVEVGTDKPPQALLFDTDQEKCVVLGSAGPGQRFVPSIKMLNCRRRSNNLIKTREQEGSTDPSRIKASWRMAEKKKESSGIVDSCTKRSSGAGDRMATILGFYPSVGVRPETLECPRTGLSQGWMLSGAGTPHASGEVIRAPSPLPRKGEG